MSDLQCAVSVVVVDSAAHGAALRGMRPAAVCSARDSVTTASELARVLDVARRDLPVDPDSPEGLVRALDDVADEYRGECVAVVVTPAVLADLVRRVLPGGAARAVVVEVDADGQRWARWPVSDATAR